MFDAKGGTARKTLAATHTAHPQSARLGLGEQNFSMQKPFKGNVNPRAPYRIRREFHVSFGEGKAQD